MNQLKKAIAITLIKWALQTLPDCEYRDALAIFIIINDKKLDE